MSTKLKFKKKFILIGETNQSGRLRQNVWRNKFWSYHKKADAVASLEKMQAKDNYKYKLALITIFE